MSQGRFLVAQRLQGAVCHCWPGFAAGQLILRLQPRTQSPEPTPGTSSLPWPTPTVALRGRRAYSAATIPRDHTVLALPVDLRLNAA